MSETTLIEAVGYLQGDSVGRQRPNTGEVVAALATAEKQSKRAKQRYDYAQLVGTWQLGFVSGTRKVSPARAGAKPVKQLGKGRFLPRWINITITYGPQAQLLSPKLLKANEASDETGTNTSDLQSSAAVGAVVNRVAFGALRLQLSGPTRYWPGTNTLGFDFVYLNGGAGPLTLYDAPVRGGIEKAKIFAVLPLKEQAFFTFFAMTPDYIAARGKGGGLALWTRSTSEE